MNADILSIARECGAAVHQWEGGQIANIVMSEAALAAYTERIRSEQRERDARKVEAEEVEIVSREDRAYNLAIEHCAASIRRGDAAPSEGEMNG